MYEKHTNDIDYDVTTLIYYNNNNIEAFRKKRRKQTPACSIASVTE